MNILKHPSLCMLLILILQGTGANPEVKAQVRIFSVTDYVDLPPELGGGAGTGLYLEFSENWSCFPDLQAFRKETRSFVVRETEERDLDQGMLKQLLAAKVGQLPLSRGKATISGVEYEFSLLDPHLEGSPPEGFPEQDSIDLSARELQAVLIELVKDGIRNVDRYDLDKQLLSVRFTETWYIHPVTMEISRQVDAITPVIWQRRRTAAGEPVNDAETGWPVYYKNNLAPIRLRNP